MANRLFQIFGEENVGEFTIANISHFNILEIGWVKYWRMIFILLNSLKFSPAKILRHTIYPYNLGEAMAPKPLTYATYELA